jgi:signal transduction histidine kinase
MHSPIPSEDIFRRLVHDLRQPLSNIETSIFYLDLVLDRRADRAREQLRIMERQIAQATDLVGRAADELRRHSAQRGVEEGVAPLAAAVESFVLTKSATAGVT